MSDPVLVRRPAVAGTFYPARRDELLTALREAFADSAPPPDRAPEPKALIVPHAGYPYSGPIAASGYRRLLQRHEPVRRVVLIGPSHRVPLRGMAVSGADAWETPLGLVPIDCEARRIARTVPGVAVDDGAHAPEHSLEVQLPFLQTVLDDFALLPVVVGSATPTEVAALLRELWGGPETLIVISTDLSHYETSDSARRHDAVTATAIREGLAADIGPDDACGVRGLAGALTVATDLGLHIEEIDVRNSGDTAGDPFRVVGYGAFAIH